MAVISVINLLALALVPTRVVAAVNLPVVLGANIDMQIQYTVNVARGLFNTATLILKLMGVRERE